MIGSLSEMAWFDSNFELRLEFGSLRAIRRISPTYAYNDKVLIHRTQAEPLNQSGVVAARRTEHQNGLAHHGIVPSEGWSSGCDTPDGHYVRHGDQAQGGRCYYGHGIGIKIEYPHTCERLMVNEESLRAISPKFAVDGTQVFYIHKLGRLSAQACSARHTGRF